MYRFQWGHMTIYIDQSQYRAWPKYRVGAVTQPNQTPLYASASDTNSHSSYLMIITCLVFIFSSQPLISLSLSM